MKFPLLLAQGAEGIAVGLSSKILPHNFNEICDAAVSYLRGEPFSLYPDFPTGGSIDASRYNDGQRGGVVKVRAKIEKLDPRHSSSARCRSRRRQRACKTPSPRPWRRAS